MSDLPSFQEIHNILQGKSRIPVEDLYGAERHIKNVFREIQHGVLTSVKRDSVGHIITYIIGIYDTDIVWSATEFCKPLTNWLTSNGYQSDIHESFFHNKKKTQLTLTVYLYKKDTSALAQMRG
jgi:hypothetical protein